MRPVCKHLAGSRSHGGSLMMSVVRHTSVVSARSARHIVQACPAQWQALAHEAGPGPLSAATCRSLPSPQHTRAVAGCSLWGSASFCTGRRCIAAGTATRTPATNGNGTSAADCLSDQLKIESRLFEPPDTPNPPTFVKTDGRVIAIGDIHGDLEKTMDALQLAGVLTLDQGRPVWTGGDTVVVQVGDVLDRGDQEIVTVMLLRDLHRQAKREGGAVHMLNGNHESLNVCGDFRYVTEGAFIESGQVAGLSGQVSWQTLVRARVGLYAPGGAMAIELSKNPTVLVVNDTVFAHGGLLPMHVSYGLEKINQEVASWMRAEILEDGSYAPPPFIAMGDSNSIVWNRTFGRESFKSFYDQFRAGKTLTEMLEPLGVKRLVIGHTPQVAGANAELEERVWRIDVGMSSGVLGAPAAVLEIVKNESGDTEVQVLSIDGPPSEPSPQELLAAQGL